MSNELEPVVQSELAKGLSSYYGVTSDAFISTMRAVAMPKGHTIGELLSCLIVAAEHKLNPLTKEIYFMRGKSGIQPIVSVDGWIKKCNEHDQFDGMEFETTRDDDGKMVAMRCRIYRKDRSRPIEIEEDFEECSKGGGPVWKTHPNRMMRNRTLCQAARIAFGLAGLMEPEEFRQWQENPDIPAVDVTPIEPVDGGEIDFRGEKVKRPSRQTAMDMGLQEKHAALLKSLESDKFTTADLKERFAGFEKDGAPWAVFPRAWAAMLQEAYRYALADAEGDEKAPEVENTDIYETFKERLEVAEDLTVIYELETEFASQIPAEHRDEFWDLIEARRDQLARAFV